MGKSLTPKETEAKRTDTKRDLVKVKTANQDTFLRRNMIWCRWSEEGTIDGFCHQPAKFFREGKLASGHKVTTPVCPKHKNRNSKRI